jgi:hypothetical protein
MADERDDQVAAAYRALGAEEPPRALDEAILAAGRQAAAPKPWTKRWAVPLSLAAVLVLSVTVTLRIQHDAPELQAPTAARELALPKQETAVAAAPAAVPAEAPAKAPLKLKQEERIKAPAREPKPFADQQRERLPAREQAASAAPPPAAAAPQARQEEFAARTDAARTMESSVAGANARQVEERVARDAEAAARSPLAGPALAKRSQASADAAPAKAAGAVASQSQPVGLAAVAPLLQELERIAALRAEGRHDEADKALAEFRRRNPDYRIPDDMLKRVERRP